MRRPQGIRKSGFAVGRLHFQSQSATWRPGVTARYAIQSRRQGAFPSWLEAHHSKHGRLSVIDSRSARRISLTGLMR